MAHRTDAWIWGLVLSATAGVLALAILRGHRNDRIDKPAPSVTLPALGGGQSSIAAGKVTMVDFWATWCAPCRASMPRLQKVWQEYKPSGVDLYSVDTDDETPDRDAQVREFLLQNGLTFPVVLDDGHAAEAFLVQSLPTMVLVDRQGRIAWSHVGALTGSRETELRAAIDHALGRR
jgi:thiol-disulfide isomerase/thioredoxin